MAKVFIYETPFEHTLSPDKLNEALARIDEARSFAEEVRGHLLVCIRAGDLAGQLQARKQIASDPRSKLFSAIRANCKLKLAKREPLEICLSIASKLDFSKPLLEEVLVHPQKQKNSNKYQLSCEFGLWYRTGQDIVLRIMECYLQPKLLQFEDVPGSINAVKFAVATGCVYYARLNISRFYESFELEKLSPILPLSHELVEHVISGRHMKVKGVKVNGFYVSDSSWDALLLQARQGLLKGSACSPIVGAFTISHLRFAPAEGEFLVNYADEFLLLAEELELLEAALEELVQAIKKLPGGHFVPKKVAQGSAYGAIKFLGHELQILNGKLKTTVSRATVESVLSQWHELKRRVDKHGRMIGQTDIAESKELLARMYAFAQGWRAVFKECDDVDEINAFMGQIEDYTKTLNVDFSEIIALVDESMQYRPDAYTLGK